MGRLKTSFFVMRVCCWNIVSKHTNKHRKKSIIKNISFPEFLKTILPRLKHCSSVLSDSSSVNKTRFHSYIQSLNSLRSAFLYLPKVQPRFVFGRQLQFIFMVVFTLVFWHSLIVLSYDAVTSWVREKFLSLRLTSFRSFTCVSLGTMSNKSW